MALSFEDPAAQHPVEQFPQRINVTRKRNRCRAAIRYFRRRIEARSCNFLRGGESLSLLVNEAQTEISHNWRLFVPQINIVGLDISVDYAVMMGVRYSCADLTKNSQYFQDTTT